MFVSYALVAIFPIWQPNMNSWNWGVLMFFQIVFKMLWFFMLCSQNWGNFPTIIVLRSSATP
jgi:peptidoglycan/LPS O-acetylase OafA/YrhL